MNGKEQEIRKVVADLDALLDGLRANVEALNSILTSHDGEQEATLP